MTNPVNTPNTPQVPVAASAGRAPVRARAGRPTRVGRPPVDQVHTRIAMLRVERGLTRQELAHALRVSLQTISGFERGTCAPALANALKIARFFDLPVEAIFSLDRFPRLTSDQLSREPS